MLNIQSSITSEKEAVAAAAPLSAGSRPDCAQASFVAEGQSFAALLSDVLKEQASQQLASAASLNDASIGDFGQLSANGYGGVSSALFSSLSQEGNINPELAMTLLLSLIGGNSDNGMATLSGMLPYLAAGADSGQASGITAEAGNLTISAAASRAYNAAGEAVPAQAWIAANPAVTGNEDNRSAALLRTVIDQFKVGSSERYRPYKNGSDTYCNIFVWDVTSALGAEIPHYVDRYTGAPRSYPDTDGAKELSANGVCDWLEKSGSGYGWIRVSAKEAQEYANSGRPAVTAWKNDSGSGHVQIVCPSKDGGYDGSKGVTVAQAGRKNSEYSHITSTFKTAALSEVKYYVHL